MVYILYRTSLLNQIVEFIVTVDIIPIYELHMYRGQWVQ